jgi:hypothetical protein
LYQISPGIYYLDEDWSNRKETTPYSSILAMSASCTDGFGTCTEKNNQLKLDKQYSGGDRPRSIATYDKSLKQLDVMYEETPFIIAHLIVHAKLQCH